MSTRTILNNIVINSVGGCGSKYLIRQIANQLNVKSFASSHKHIASPLDMPLEVDKVVFVIGDLYLSLLSFFKRRDSITKLHGFYEREHDKPGNIFWAKEHCKNVGGDAGKLNENWGLTEYLSNQRDLFKLNDFYANWLDTGILTERSFDVCYIKYDSFRADLTRVTDFLEISKTREFEPFKPRNSSYEAFSAPQIQLLELLYGDTQRKLVELPQFFTKKELTSRG